MRTGVSALIGKLNHSLMVLGSRLCETEILIKLFPDVQGIMFGVSIKMLNKSRNMALFNDDGCIKERSMGFRPNISNIFESFPCVDLHAKQKKFFVESKKAHYSVEVQRLERRLYHTNICTFKEVSCRTDLVGTRTYRVIAGIKNRRTALNPLELLTTS